MYLILQELNLNGSLKGCPFSQSVSPSNRHIRLLDFAAILMRDRLISKPVVEFSSGTDFNSILSVGLLVSFLPHPVGKSHSSPLYFCVVAGMKYVKAEPNKIVEDRYEAQRKEQVRLICFKPPLYLMPSFNNVISVHASFLLPHRNTNKRGPILALRITGERTVASYGYKLHSSTSSEKNVLVFDLGGNFFADSQSTQTAATTGPKGSRGRGQEVVLVGGANRILQLLDLLGEILSRNKDEQKIFKYMLTDPTMALAFSATAQATIVKVPKKMGAWLLGEKVVTTAPAQTV